MVETYSISNGDIKLSDNFWLHEVACKGYDEVQIDTDVIAFAQEIRNHYARAVKITSGYRPKAYNELLIKRGYKASRTSQHLQGKALDIKVSGVSPLALYRYCDKLIGDKGGVGIYSWGVHIDCRGKKSRWDYR